MPTPFFSHWERHWKVLGCSKFVKGWLLQEESPHRGSGSFEGIQNFLKVFMVWDAGLIHSHPTLNTRSILKCLGLLSFFYEGGLVFLWVLGRSLFFWSNLVTTRVSRNLVLDSLEPATIHSIYIYICIYTYMYVCTYLYTLYA